MSIDVDLLKWGIDKGLELGAFEVEIFSSYEEGFSLELMMGIIPKMYKSVDMGAGIRVVVDKRIGFSYLTKFDKESLERGLKDAISAAKASRPLEYWISLPEPSAYPQIRDLYDERVKEIEADYLIENISTIAKELASKDRRINVTQISAGAGVSEKFVLNSNGISVSNKGTLAFVAAVAMGVEGNERTPMLFSFDASRKKELSTEKVVEELAHDVQVTLKKAKGKTEKATVIFHPDALRDILSFTLVQSLSGEKVLRSRTPFKDKLGEKIASELFTVIDDGTKDGGLASMKMDDEGVPTKKKILIDNGVLKGFYHDNYTAKALNHELTGNGSRSGGPAMTSPAYASTPRPAVTNFIIEPGDISFEEILEEIKRGYVLVGVQGAHSSNPESGEFSVAAAPIWRVNNGEIVGAVRGSMVSGNIYELLDRILFVSKEQKEIFNMYLPYIAFKDVNVITMH
ncbi:MAG: TldD/PmbA family protein [Candidatus Njordarchaeia archaeon]